MSTPFWQLLRALCAGGLMASLSLLAAQPALPGTSAGQATMVADLATPALNDRDSNVANLTASASNLFFTVDDDSHGTELWASDGTTAGTRLVEDITPGPDGTTFASLTNVAGTLFFLVNDRELWKSDGTAPGTALVAKLPAAGTPTFTAVAAAGARLFFTMDDGSHGAELWTSDGTAPGTTLVKDIAPTGQGSEPSELVALGETLFFSADDGVSGRELWKSNGTPAGTTLVKDIAPAGRGSGPSELVALGNTLFFSADDGESGRELWKSDGTATGTALVKDIVLKGEGADPRQLTILGTTLLFSAATPAQGRELWKSDGTSAGTALVKEIVPGAANGITTWDFEMRAAGNRVFFLTDASGSGAYDLWKSNGTAAGTSMVKGALKANGSCEAAPQLTTLGTTLLFVVGYARCPDEADPPDGAELWRSNGTSAGTHIERDIYPGIVGSNPEELTIFNGKLYFAARDRDHGRELWVSNDTTEGTVMLRQFTFGGEDSTLRDLTDVAGTLFFGADSGHSRRFDIYKSDGSAQGTLLVDTLERSSELRSRPRYWPNEFTALGNLLYFATDGMLWRSDGTSAGTVIVKNLCCTEENAGPWEITRVGNRLFFTGEPIGRARLHVSDGTEAGTISLGPSNSYSLTAWHDIIVFRSLSGNTPRLWKSDGTPDGTTPIASIESWPVAIRAAGSHLFVMSTEDATSTIWVSDGTSAGTAAITTLDGHEEDAFGERHLLPTALGERLFFAYNDGVHGRELWVSDGTAAGTHLVADLRPGALGAAPEALTALGGQLYFSADDGVAGRELWVSDGTTAGTRLVRDSVPGPAGATPGALAAIDGQLFFAAADSGHGRELWVADEGGARMLQDLNPGPGDANPAQFTLSGGRIFFTASDGMHGNELWALPQTGESPEPHVYFPLVKQHR